MAAPAGMPPSTPAGMPPSGPAGVPLSTPAGMPPSATAGMPLSTPAGIPPSTPAGIPPSTPAGIPPSTTADDGALASHGAPPVWRPASHPLEPASALEAGAGGIAPPVSFPGTPAGPPGGAPRPGAVAQALEAPATGDASASSVAAAGPPAAPRTRRERFRAWRFAPVVEIIATIALALVLAESVQAAVVKPFVIPSQSMEPTLLPGQRVLVNRLAYDFGGLPQRGDIVVFHPPSSLTCAANVPATEPCPRGVGSHASDYFVKRVIGLPGDRLSIKDGHPVINGKELTDEPYITHCTDSTSCEMPHAIVIPRGEYYMLGDNRGDSDDSRYWGPVPLSWIIGEVFATYWPIDRIGFF
jgi:signal peptidase I